MAAAQASVGKLRTACDGHAQDGQDEALFPDLRVGDEIAQFAAHKLLLDHIHQTLDLLAMARPERKALDHGSKELWPGGNQCRGQLQQPPRQEWVVREVLLRPVRLVRQVGDPCQIAGREGMLDGFVDEG